MAASEGLVGSTAAGAERQISGVKCGPSSEKHGLLVGLSGVFGVKPFINFDLIVPVHISNFSVSEYKMESVVNDNVMNDDNNINSDGDSYEEDSELKSGNNIVDGDTITKKKRKSSNSSISNAKGERKKTSYVWDHFKEISDSNNEAKSEKDVVECNYCGKCIAYKPSYGTSGMKNHIARCKRFPANLNRKQKLVDFESKTITSPDWLCQSRGPLILEENLLELEELEDGMEDLTLNQPIIMIDESYSILEEDGENLE
ncbi:hypothetical protein V6N12_004696 [Hibiscus sabdariffa]|uniref:BED-type domain-containing protein n=1 Tax=Hibiscus sabdariffa TaxID=183260 RepID=A0ABR2CM92_9ROSI